MISTALLSRHHQPGLFTISKVMFGLSAQFPPNNFFSFHPIFHETFYPHLTRRNIFIIWWCVILFDCSTTFSRKVWQEKGIDWKGYHKNVLYMVTKPGINNLACIIRYVAMLQPQLALLLHFPPNNFFSLHPIFHETFYPPHTRKNIIIIWWWVILLACSIT